MPGARGALSHCRRKGDRLSVPVSDFSGGRPLPAVCSLLYLALGFAPWDRLRSRQGGARVIARGAAILGAVFTQGQRRPEYRAGAIEQGVR